MKRFQVFLSSTFSDLEDVRQAILENLPSLNCFASAMEYFDNVDQGKQWELIAREIAASDYYVLIIGDRYGTIEEGHTLSFTEREFDLAKKLGKPILTFLKHQTKVRKSIPPEEAAALKRFREKAREVNSGPPWKTPANLSALIIRNLPKFIQNHPMPGWIRSEESDEVHRKRLEEVATLKSALEKCENRASSEKNRTAFAARSILSHRFTLPDGDHPSIYGIVIFEKQTRVVARFVGPSLERFGVKGVIRRPFLQLTNQIGAVLETGKEYRSLDEASFATLSKELTSLGVFQIENSTTDVVLSVCLDPGAYTFLCRSRDALGGIGLLELYTYKE